MVGDVNTKRRGLFRYEATYEVAPFAWVVAYSYSPWMARRALRRRMAR